MDKKSSDDMLTIGRTLRLLRTIDDISAKELAREIGLSQAYISEIETGKKEPTLRVLNAYGKYFGISPADLLYIQEEGLTGSNAEHIVRIIEMKAGSKSNEGSRAGKPASRASKTERKSVVVQPV